jgi:photosystem II stability/assembly factor-like uncharacterized protein/cytoskeletal protein CcmA (bactofilin family)
MSWKKYGGTNKLDKFNNLSVNTIVADKLTIKKSYIGDWDISGGISSTGDANFNRDVNVQGTITCGNINITGTLGVLDTQINGNLTVDYNLFVREDLYLDANGSSLIHADQGNFGFNTYDPIATIDISGNTEASIYIQSSAPNNKNVLAQNATHGAITLNVTPAAAYIDFYVDNSLNQANDPDARLAYEANGFFTIDVSDTMTVKPRTIFAQDITKTFKDKERVIIYGNADTNNPYLPNVYQDLDASFNTGTIVQIVALDNSSNAFVEIATDQGKGMAIGGGYFTKNRIMGTLALTDTAHQKYPALNIISGNLNKHLKTSIAVNKPDVSTAPDGANKYAMDINGPVKLTHQELTSTYDASFQIYATGFFNDLGVAFGSPNALFEQNFLRTTDGGNTWTKTRFVDQDNQPNPNSLETTAHTLGAVFVDDSSTIYVAGDTGYIFRSTNGGSNWSIVSNNGYNLNFTAINLTENNLIIGIDDGRIIRSTSLTAVNGAPESTGLSYVAAIASSNANNIIIVGSGGIVLYDAIANVIQAPLATGATFNAVDVYNTVHAIAVGTNAIYYTHDLNTWTPITINSTILTSVKIFDENRAIASTNLGTILYSIDGFQTWTSRAVSASPLTTVNILNINDFVLTANTGANTSETINLYAPDLINRQNHNIIEASGNIVVSGDLHINDMGQILTNNTTFNILPTVAQEINIGNATLGGNTNIKTNLDVMLNITGHKNLLITGDSSLNGNLMVVRDTSVNQNLYIGQDVSINNQLYVKSRSLFEGDMSLTQNLSLTSLTQNKSLAINKDISSAFALDVSGQTNLRGQTQLVGDVSINGRLVTSSDVSFNNNAYIALDLSVNQNLFVTNRSVFRGDVSLNQNLSLTSATQNKSLAINKDISSAFALDVSGQTNLRGLTAIIGDLSINGRLFTSSDVSFNSKLLVTNDVSFNQNMTVSGNATISKLGLGTTAITSNYTLDVNGSAWIRNNIDVSGSLSVQTNINSYGTIIQW